MQTGSTFIIRMNQEEEAMITYEMACDLFDYNPITGDFKWSTTPNKKYFNSDRAYKRHMTLLAGKLINSKDTGGYIQANWDYQSYRVHRLIWLMQTGSWPKGQIDHKDHIRHHNWFSNLRDIPEEHNKALKINNTTGYANVSYNPKCIDNPWYVSIFSKGKYITKAYFNNLTDALDHRDKVRKLYGLSSLPR